VLQAFTKRYSITFPLLSDAGSAAIKRFGLLNREEKAGTSTYGIPYPGTFLVNRNGVITHRFFEASYRERDATSSVLLSVGGGPAGASTQLTTPHLRATVALSDPTVSPGHRFSVVFDVDPLPGMHVYAQGKHDYRPIMPLMDPAPALTIHDIDWPPSREYYFQPLDERVPVYDAPFRFVLPMTLKVAEGNELLKKGDKLTISGAVSYQACDDKICYLPQTLPFSLTVGLKPLIRDR
jgi:hypothetical protein